MKKTIGETIRDLRLARNLTQEQLAENLNVTAQAISKWENNVGMPDISQVIPIAHFFGVSTDTLFGVECNQPIDEVQDTIAKATAMDSYKDEYLLLKTALKQYPGDTRLLIELLSCGECLLADGDSVAGPERTEIFEECERAGKLILSYSKDPCMLMNAAGWMIKLYCEMNDTEKAFALCDKLPSNVGFNKEAALARVFETEKKHIDAAPLYEMNFTQHLRLAIHSLVLAGNMYARGNQKEVATKLYTLAISIGECVLESEATSLSEMLKKNILKSIEICRKSIEKLCR